MLNRMVLMKCTDDTNSGSISSAEKEQDVVNNQVAWMQVIY